MAKEQTEHIINKLYGGEVVLDFMPNSHRYSIEDRGVKVKPSSVTGIIGRKDKSSALILWATRLCGQHILDTLAENGEVTKEDVIAAVNLHQQKKEEAGDIGSKMHDWCEKFVKYKLKELSAPPELPEDPQILLGVNSFLEWYNNNDVEFLFSERFVYSRMYRYVGKADLGAIVNGKKAIIDFKSANGLYPEVGMQLAAYAEAIEEEDGHGEPFETRIAIRLAKETEEEWNNRHLKNNTFKKNPVSPPKYDPFETLEFSDDDRSFDFSTFLNLQGVDEWIKKNDKY